jgi:uncharacterized membrane protein
MFLRSSPSATTRSRSLIKTLTWRVLATSDTFAIGYLVTGNVAWAGSIAGIEVATKLVAYYFHERAWSRVKWGRADTTVEAAG